MQKIATLIFIYASVVFGIIGLLLITATDFGPNKSDTAFSQLLIRCLFGTVFVILPSFALSVAGKYLKK